MNLTSPLRVIIVEDQIGIRQKLEHFLHQQPGFIVIGACGTVYEAIVMIHNSKPDLVLLDISLPDGTGFDILEQLPARMKVIFLTAYQEYAIRAIRYGAIDYLLKPFNEQELQEALQKVVSARPLLQEQIDITLLNFKENKPPDHIALQSWQFVQIAELKEIRYLQADNGLTTVFLDSGEKVVTTKSIKDYEELFVSTSFFLRTHQSYLVNERYIYRYHPKEGILYLKDGTIIPVAYRKKLKVDQRFKLL
jgi:two-component system LytT family response regulator